MDDKSRIKRLEKEIARLQAQLKRQSRSYHPVMMKVGEILAVEPRSIEELSDLLDISRREVSAHLFTLKSRFFVRISILANGKRALDTPERLPWLLPEPK